jgi:flagellar biogenesis protein FliO
MRSIASLLFFAIALFCPLARAAEPLKQPPHTVEWQEDAQKEAPSENRFSLLFVKMLLMLGITLIILVSVAWISKKFLQGRMLDLNKTCRVQVVERRALSAKGHVVLIKIDESELLIAETPGTITLLKEIEHPVKL